MRRSLRARVTAVARHDWEGAGLDAPLYATGCHELLARRMKRQAGLAARHPDPLHYAARVGLNALPQEVGGYGVETDGALIRFSWAGSPRSCGLRVYYGLACCLLRRQFGDAYTEAGAWLLALEMSIPRVRLAEVGPAAFAQEQLHVPLWAIDAVSLATPPRASPSRRPPHARSVSPALLQNAFTALDRWRAYRHSGSCPRRTTGAGDPRCPPSLVRPLSLASP